jgi:hypothetical protein
MAPVLQFAETVLVVGATGPPGAAIAVRAKAEVMKRANLENILSEFWRV